MNGKRNILITGGNRGIGFGLLKTLSDKHNVIITVRDNEKGKNALSRLVHSKNEVSYVVMDVNNPNSVISAVNDIVKIFDNIDLLINNAGILIKEYDLPAIETSEESILKTFNTNTLGVLEYANQLSQ